MSYIDSSKEESDGQSQLKLDILVVGYAPTFMPLQWMKQGFNKMKIFNETETSKTLIVRVYSYETFFTLCFENNTLEILDGILTSTASFQS